jgi:outer membrane protein assembly factor BamB
MRRLATFAFLTATASLAVASSAAPRVARGADWPVFDKNAARSGVSDDRTLTPQNAAKLHEQWHVMLGDVADSAPIVVGDRLFLTRRDGTTMAIDTNDGRVVWRFATHGPKITSSVPAYDEVTHALFVPGVDGAVHKLDPSSGNERRDNGFPVPITRVPETEKDASSLNVANGYVYAQTSGYVGDATPYVGHVVAIRLSDGVARVFNSLCSNQTTLIDPQSCPGQRSGMWSRAGVVVDPDPAMHGRIYAATGNGPFNAGDELESSDRDVGSSSPALLPRQNASATPLLAVQGGKDSTLRLFDRTKLGGLGAPLQTLALGSELFSAPAVWTDSHGAAFAILGLSDGVHAYRITTEDRRTRLVPAWSASIAAGNQGTSPAVDGDVAFFAASGQLVALDARTGHRLWSNAIGAIHWESPVAANGSVYCTDETGALTAFRVTSTSH